MAIVILSITFIIFFYGFPDQKATNIFVPDNPTKVIHDVCGVEKPIENEDFRNTLIRMIKSSKLVDYDECAGAIREMVVISSESSSHYYVICRDSADFCVDIYADEGHFRSYELYKLLEKGNLRTKRGEGH